VPQIAFQSEQVNALSSLFDLILKIITDIPITFRPIASCKQQLNPVNYTLCPEK